MKIAAMMTGVCGLAMLAGAQELPGLSFTNVSGLVVSNAAIVRVEADRVFYRTERGGGAVALADLPADWQARLGYDASRAEASAAARAEREARLRVQLAAQAEANAREYRRQRALIDQDKSKVAIYGIVAQRHKDGELRIRTVTPPQVFSHLYGSEGRQAFRTPTSGAEGRPLWSGELILLNHPQARTLVEDDLVNVAAWPDGVTEYTTVLSAGRTLRRFNCVRPPVVVE
jgi:hypothetical protein